jgi:hypothetical protein
MTMLLRRTVLLFVGVVMMVTTMMIAMVPTHSLRISSRIARIGPSLAAIALALASAVGVGVGVLFPSAASCLPVYVGDISEPCRPDIIDTVADFCRHGIIAHAEIIALSPAIKPTCRRHDVGSPTCCDMSPSFL